MRATGMRAAVFEVPLQSCAWPLLFWAFPEPCRAHPAKATYAHPNTGSPGYRWDSCMAQDMGCSRSSSRSSRESRQPT